jgi:hypothetical protein
MTNATFCDRHIGEAHPPRCITCETLTAEWLTLNLRVNKTATSREANVIDHETIERDRHLAGEVEMSARIRALDTAVETLQRQSRVWERRAKTAQRQLRHLNIHLSHNTNFSN